MTTSSEQSLWGVALPRSQTLQLPQHGRGSALTLRLTDEAISLSSRSAYASQTSCPSPAAASAPPPHRGPYSPLFLSSLYQSAPLTFQSPLRPAPLCPSAALPLPRLPLLVLAQVPRGPHSLLHLSEAVLDVLGAPGEGRGGLLALFRARVECTVKEVRPELGGLLLEDGAVVRGTCTGGGGCRGGHHRLNGLERC